MLRLRDGASAEIRNRPRMRKAKGARDDVREGIRGARVGRAVGLHGAHAAPLRRAGAGAGASSGERIPALRAGGGRPLAAGAAVPRGRPGPCRHQTAARRPVVRCARRAGRASARTALPAHPPGRIDRERGENARQHGRERTDERRREVRGVQAGTCGRTRRGTEPRRASAGATRPSMRATRR